MRLISYALVCSTELYLFSFVLLNGGLSALLILPDGAYLFCFILPDGSLSALLILPDEGLSVLLYTARRRLICSSLYSLTEAYLLCFILPDGGLCVPLYTAQLSLALHSQRGQRVILLPRRLILLALPEGGSTISEPEIALTTVDSRGDLGLN
ncbi:hypothetical protein RRG08_021618 [Elysia crispata]|uniref:Uncharacterized protein n=1 Tax=Elysia crispata TaxID=231223 RepID=A0AAE0XDQ2_9GAST|nr:hypothetical protein RRG08_021618 [Elysia crispata]